MRNELYFRIDCKYSMIFFVSILIQFVFRVYFIQLYFFILCVFLFISFYVKRNFIFVGNSFDFSSILLENEQKKKKNTKIEFRNDSSWLNSNNSSFSWSFSLVLSFYLFSYSFLPFDFFSPFLLLLLYWNVRESNGFNHSNHCSPTTTKNIERIRNWSGAMYRIYIFIFRFLFVWRKWKN